MEDWEERGIRVALSQCVEVGSGGAEGEWGYESRGGGALVSVPSLCAERTIGMTQCQAQSDIRKDNRWDGLLPGECQTE